MVSTSFTPFRSKSGGKRVAPAATTLPPAAWQPAHVFANVSAGVPSARAEPAPRVSTIVAAVDTITFQRHGAPAGFDSVFDTESQVGLDDTLDAFLRGIFCRLRHATRGAVVAGVMTEAIMVFDLATSRRTRTSGTTEGGSKWQRGRGAGG